MNRKIYQTPAIEVVGIRAEQGFALSVENGVEGPSFGEENVEW